MKKRIESAEMKFLRRIGDYRLIEEVRISKIIKELKIEAILSNGNSRTGSN